MWFEEKVGKPSGGGIRWIMGIKDNLCVVLDLSGTFA